VRFAAGVGPGAALAGVGSVDAGRSTLDAPPDATRRTDGHPTPLWSVTSGPDRSVHLGEARATWLYAIAWPPEAAYALVDGLRRRELAGSLPGELKYGADSRRLLPVRGPPSGPPTAHAATNAVDHRVTGGGTGEAEPDSSAERINQTGWN
jgi:hypothetical protein